MEKENINSSEIASEITSSLETKPVTNKNITKEIYDPRKKKDGEVIRRVWSSESVELARRGLDQGYELKETPFNKNIKDFNLRAANIPFEMSPEERELKKIFMKDKIKFGDNIVSLKDAEFGWTKIKLRPYQVDLLKKYRECRWNILMFPRQSGKTTTTVVEIIHYAISNIDKDIVVIAQNDNVVNELVYKVKSAFASLPFYMQPGFLKFTADEAKLDNGCRIKFGVASESVVQGFALDFLFIDEFAYIADSKVNKFWINIYPALSNNPNSKCIIASTPNGRNLFYELWQNSVLGKNRFINSRIYWHEVPRRESLEEFKQNTIDNVGLEGWLMGYECSFDTKLNSIFHTSIQQMLRRAQEEHIKEWSFENDIVGDMYGFKFLNKEKFDYNIKEDYFVIGVDIGEGLSQDYTVVKTRKLIYDKVEKKLKFKLVSVFHDNETPIDDFARLLLGYLNEFDSSKIQVSIENNNYGGELIAQINALVSYDEEFMNFDMNCLARFMRKSKDDYEIGVRMDAASKRTGVTFYKSLIVNSIFDDTYNESVDEALNFGRNKNGTYSAQYGHDDLVMCDVAIASFVKSNNMYAKQFLEMVEFELKLQLRLIEDEFVREYLEREELERKRKEVEEYGVTANGGVVRVHGNYVGMKNKKRLQHERRIMKEADKLFYKQITNFN